MPPIERESGQDSGARMWILDGNVNEPGDVGEGPGKSFLFSLTCQHDPEIGLSGARVPWSEELDTSVGSGASSTALENPGERIDFHAWSYS